MQSEVVFGLVIPLIGTYFVVNGILLLSKRGGVAERWFATRIRNEIPLTPDKVETKSERQLRMYYGGLQLALGPLLLLLGGRVFALHVLPRILDWFVMF